LTVLQGIDEPADAITPHCVVTDERFCGDAANPNSERSTWLRDVDEWPFVAL
jgi:hypothetical protein